MKKMSIEWSKSLTTKLINLYCEEQCMWNLKHPDYKDQEQRISATQRIVDSLQQDIPDVTFKEVKLKIHSLRSQHRKEVFAVATTKKTKRLWCWNLLKFLLPHTIILPGQRSKGNEPPAVRDYLVQWDRPTTRQLIKLYRPMTCLWNRDHPDFQTKAKRDLALNSITEQLRQYVRKIKVEDVKMKIHSLQSQYRKELRALARAKRRGCVKDKPTFWGFKLLDFLRQFNDVDDVEFDESLPENTLEDEQTECLSAPPDDEYDDYEVLSDGDNIIASHPPKFNWNKKNTAELIELFREQRLLWNRNHVSHMNKRVRDKALQLITTQMRKSYNTLTMEQVKRKIFIIRTQHRRELKAFKDFKENHPNEDILNRKSTLWCFNLLDFLHPNLVDDTKMQFDEQQDDASEQETDAYDWTQECEMDSLEAITEISEDNQESSDSNELTEPELEELNNLSDLEESYTSPSTIKDEINFECLEIETLLSPSATTTSAEHVNKRRRLTTEASDEIEETLHQLTTSPTNAEINTEKQRYNWLGEQIVETLNAMHDEEIIDEAIASVQRIINEAKAKDRKARRTKAFS